MTGDSRRLPGRAGPAQPRRDRGRRRLARVRIDLQRLLKTEHGFRDAALVGQREAQEVVPHCLPWKTGHHVLAHGLAVAPEGCLTPGAPRQHGQCQHRRAAAHPTTPRPRPAEVRHGPGKGKVHADLGQIRKAIGHGLDSAAELNHSANRHQHSYVPQPADEQIRTSPPEYQCPNGDA